MEENLVTLLVTHPCLINKSLIETQNKINSLEIEPLRSPLGPRITHMAHHQICRSDEAIFPKKQNRNNEFVKEKMKINVHIIGGES